MRKNKRVRKIKKKGKILKKEIKLKKETKKEKSLSTPSLILKNKKKNAFPLAKIKVVGVGGAGGNVISRMFDYFPRGIDLVAINTDLQDLENCLAKRKVYIGKQVTKGLGAGMNPELGRQAAYESKEEIAKILEGADLVFLTAGLGGGTGSGALPVIAEIAQELGVLTIAVVTKPFAFEGAQRSQIAQEALSHLREKVDALITIANDRIFLIIDKETSLQKAFEAIDEVLKNAVLGITEIIVSPGIINVDFADVRTIVKNSGSAIIGVGIASGKERALTAANLALNSPLLETSIDGAKGILFSVSGHRDLKMYEINEIAKVISESVDPNAKIIFGTYYDKKLDKGQIKVTLIATGFGSLLGRTAPLFEDFSYRSLGKNPISFESGLGSSKIEKESLVSDKESSSSKKEKEIVEPQEEKEEDFWEIPAFLRKKKKR
ncbi:MAG: hypothetical protein KatS3mg098_219 [Candidatus Parcubacteria bacterium]|nr:cell division protein FtsZ [Patescibacteria group bacterium]BCX15990.1 MAG: hypothetical protein KatS3mg098_219 [Candidatus Parcubacteria bacterium]